VSANDPAVYVSVAAVLVTLAVLASLAPALRAAKVDPNVVLRQDG
jgi:ABC-type lipoprotein release transport system permease subunit